VIFVKESRSIQDQMVICTQNNSLEEIKEEINEKKMIVFIEVLLIASLMFYLKD